MKLSVVLTDYISLQNRYSGSFADRADGAGIGGFFGNIDAAAVYNIGNIACLEFGSKCGRTK